MLIVYEFLLGYILTKGLDHIIFSRDIDRQLLHCLFWTYFKTADHENFTSFSELQSRITNAINKFNCFMSDESMDAVFTALQGRKVTDNEFSRYLLNFGSELSKHQELFNYVNFHGKVILPIAISRLALNQSFETSQLPPAHKAQPMMIQGSRIYSIQGNSLCFCGSGKQYRNCHGREEI